MSTSPSSIDSLQSTCILLEFNMKERILANPRPSVHKELSIVGSLVVNGIRGIISYWILACWVKFLEVALTIVLFSCNNKPATLRYEGPGVRRRSQF